MKNQPSPNEKVRLHALGVVPLHDQAAAVAGLLLEPEIPRESAVERLLATLTRHEAAEAGSLAEYRKLLQECDDPVAALLMRLLLEDEERHHELFKRMATSLRSDLRWSHSPNVLPSKLASAGPATDALIATTRARINEERAGARELRRLSHQEKELYDGLFALLLEVMARDSEKHEGILRFILQRFEAAKRAEKEKEKVDLEARNSEEYLRLMHFIREQMAAARRAGLDD